MFLIARLHTYTCLTYIMQAEHSVCLHNVTPWGCPLHTKMFFLQKQDFTQITDYLFIGQSCHFVRNSMIKSQGPKYENLLGYLVLWGVQLCRCLLSGIELYGTSVMELRKTKTNIWKSQQQFLSRNFPPGVNKVFRFWISLHISWPGHSRQ